MFWEAAGAAADMAPVAIGGGVAGVVVREALAFGWKALRGRSGNGNGVHKADTLGSRSVSDARTMLRADMKDEINLTLTPVLQRMADNEARLADVLDRFEVTLGKANDGLVALAVSMARIEARF